MEFFLIFLIISITMGIIAGIKRLAYKMKGKNWKDAKPMESPLVPCFCQKIGKEGNLRWKAEKIGNSWNLIITDKKEFRWPAYILWEILTWEDLIAARDRIIDKILSLKEGEKWENIEPPEDIMNNKPTRLTGYGKNHTMWEICKSSEIWKLNIIKRHNFPSKEEIIHSVEANSWQELIELRDNLLQEVK
jgi:hypothetical protein